MLQVLHDSLLAGPLRIMYCSSLLQPVCDHLFTKAAPKTAPSFLYIFTKYKARRLFILRLNALDSPAQQHMFELIFGGHYHHF